MSSFFSEVGIRPWDFIQISTMFVLTMAVFFGVKDKKHFWLNYVLVLTLALQCIFMVLFHSGLTVKLFALLMLTSAVTVELIVNRKRKLLA